MRYSIIQGDCLPTLQQMADSSVDLIATDAPYALTSKHCRDGERASGGFMGKAWDGGLADPAVWRECFRIVKPGGSCMVMMTARQDCLWRSYRDLEEAGFDLNTTSLWWCYRSGFPKGGDLSKMADAKAGAEREVVGSRKKWMVPDEEKASKLGYAYGANGFVGELPITAPATDLARQLDGWFTKGKVKPAVEVIIWARKPISEKTELANMERWGVGGVNCGACMVPFGEDGQWADHTATGLATDKFFSRGETPDIEKSANPAGRFPANLLCMDDALGAGSKYFDVDAWAAEHGYTEDGWAQAAAAGVLQVAKPSRAEKNAGCEGLPLVDATLATRVAHIKGTHITEIDRKDGRGVVPVDGHNHPRRNPHPTCKPVTLFAYLCDFLCPAGGTVLDPYCGSGTTGVAALQSGRNFIGCEREPEYVAIAEARLAHAAGDREAQLTLTA